MKHKKRIIERKTFFLPLVFTMLFLMLSKVNVQAECTLEEYHYTNPFYEGVECDTFSNDIQAYDLDSESAEYTSDLQKLVEILREQLVNRENTIDLYYHCSEEITQEFFNQLVEQLFQDAVKHTGVGKEGDYIKWHYQSWTVNAAYSSNQNGGYDIHLTYGVSYLSDVYQEDQVNQAVSSLLQSLNLSDKTDYQKVKAIYDYICSNISYDYANLNDPTYTLKHSAYAALINKTSVCQGYASLFYRLALDAGVDARIIAGDAEGRHSWNIVKVDGKYYNLDSTWDAGRETYSYFLKNMNDFSDHVRDEEYITSSFIASYPVSDESYRESEGQEQVKDYEYKINNKNQVIITKYTGKEENVVTPTMIDNKPVVGIGHEAFVNLSTLKTLTISEGTQFFEGTLAAVDFNLKQVNLPSTLYLGEIEGNVFSGCNGLFNNCPVLEKISVSEDNPYLCQEKGILYTKDKKAVICCAPKTELGNLILPSTVTFINDDAFACNETLTSIQIPDGVTYIGYWAFNNCINLKNVNIPRSLKFLGQYAFHQTRLQSLRIPKEVGDVGIAGDRFTSYFEAEPIQEITVEEGNTYYKVVDGALIHDNLLLMYIGGSKQTSYTLPDYITDIAWYAFNRAENLETVILSNRLKEIPYGAFEGCSKLKEIKIPEGIEVIDDCAFFDCINLQKVYFPHSMTKIGNFLFANIQSIRDIYYAGTQEEWEKIAKGNSFDMIAPTYHYNYDDCEEGGHSYGEPTYVWSSDYSTVAAKRTCIKNASHVEEEIVDTTKKVTKEPTCTTEGSITYRAVFKNTAFKEQTKTVEEKALGHEISKEFKVDKEATCTTAGSKSKHCKNCDYKEEITVIPALGHDLKSSVTKKATCTEKGNIHIICSRCDYTKDEEITALGHNFKNGVCTRCNVKDREEGGHSYGEPTYVWSSDYSTVIAKRTCIKNESHVEEEIADTTKKVTKEPTCTTEGSITYRAVFKNTAFKEQTKTVKEKALGHEISKEFKVDKEATCTTAGSKSKHCKNCDYKEEITIIPALGHDLKSSVTKKATCTEKGNTHIICSRCDYTKDEEIVVLGHNFKNGVCTRCNVKNGGQWIKSGSRWWYRYNDGSYPASELCKIGNTWYGFDNAGWMQTGWAVHNNTWYYFSGSGAMQTGWLLDRGTWYYLKTDGKMATGWQKLNGSWYYLRESGAMQTGWLLDRGTWYYLKTDGKMATGWQKLNGSWYYLRESGAMQTGWLLDRGVWYYLYSNGKMASNAWIANWYVNGSGAWVSSR